MALVINGRCLLRPVGGVERYTRMLLEAAGRSSPDVRVVVPAKGGAPQGLPSGSNVERRGRMSGHAWEQVILPQALEAGDLLLSPANTGPLRVRRQLLVVHDLAFLHHPEWFDLRFARWYGFLMPRLVRRCAGVITVSGTMREELMRTFALKADRVHVVPPFAMDLPRPVPVGVDPGFHLFIGADDPRKEVHRGLDLLLQADPRATAVVVGRQRRSFSRTPAFEHPQVTLLPDVTDAQLAWLYDHARCLVHPSVYEGFGLPVLEALHRGCPVVARPLPVLEELFGDAVHACAFRDPADLADVFRRIPPRNEPHAPHPVADTFHRDRAVRALHRAIMSVDRT